jgi:tetratricopeptide (TPR) repeat protein
MKIYSASVGLIASVACALFSGCGTGNSQPFDLSKATYVGQESCVQCHREEAQKWTGSHHDKAMALATDSTVLADFDDVEITHLGVTSRMFRRDGKFMVNTEGPDGSLQDFEVKYVFGVDPLQQYMVEFPATPGQAASTENVIPRVQVLRLSWDTSKKEWFHLDPPDVHEKLDPTDDLHWTGIAQRWNNMCAECHSTDYQKHFSPPSTTAFNQASLKAKSGGASTAGSAGEYRSTFVEINVTCESCHGPGSVHLELAKQWMPGWNRQRGYGLANLKLTAENQIQACAPCHSRRNVVQAGFRAGDNYYDFYSNQLLTENVYYPDGQVLDEDYVHGSFIQSKMYHKGIRCSDCHDPHTARLKHDGNQVCTSCHQHPTAKYDSVAHHFHKTGTEGAQCVNCHMPSTTYMAVDARRDHSLRIPRPDLSLQIGTPNACTGCHLKIENVPTEKRDSLKLYQDWMQAAREGDQDVLAELERANRYCDEACDKWYGATRRRDEHFALAIDAGQKGKPEAEPLLRRVLSRKGFESPAIARATALQVLSQVNPEAASEEAAKLMDDEHPLVRATSAAALLGNPSPARVASLLESALSDPVRCVRTEAARTMLELPRTAWPESAGSKLRSALTELEQGLLYNNDRAGAHLALGIMAEQQGREQQAIQHYQDAVAVEPSVAGPRTNLAALLERNLSLQSPSSVEASNALVAEISRLRKEELPLLERDVKLLPTAAQIQYRYGLALYVDGQRKLAAEHLVKAAELGPRQTEYAQAAAMSYESLGQWSEAIYWAHETLKRSANAPENQMLLQRIEAGAAASKR